MFIQNSEASAKQSQELPSEVREKLSPEELAWLDAGNTVELESFTPKKLIKILQGGIFGSMSLDSDSSNNTVVFLDDSDSSNNIYMVESFG